MNFQDQQSQSRDCAAIELTEPTFTAAFEKMAENSLNFSFTTNYFNCLKHKKTRTLNSFHIKKLSQHNNSVDNASKQKYYRRSLTQQKQPKIIQRMSNNTILIQNKTKNYATKLATHKQVNTKRQPTTESKLSSNNNNNCGIGNFFVKILKPPSQEKNSKKLGQLVEDTIDEQHSITNRQRQKSSRYSKNKKKSTINIHESLAKTIIKTSLYQKSMQEMKQYISDENIKKRLSMFSQLQNTSNIHAGNSVQKSISNIRVYKEDYRRLFIDRYGKDRVTQFLELQYIVDFDQISKIMHNMIKLNRQQILMLAFLVFDQNKDGLITSEDLLAMNGLNRAQVSTNLLVQRDISKILEYIKSNRTVDDRIFDSVSHSAVTLDEQLTLMKFRIYQFQQKKKLKTAQKLQIKAFTTKRMHDQLFTLRNSSQNKDSKIRQDHFNLQGLLAFSRVITDRNSEYKFSINFDRFCTIFDTLPQIFADILFVLGGMNLPNYQYHPIDWSIFYSQTSIHKQAPVRDQNRLHKCLQRLNKLKDDKKSLRVIHW